LFITRTGGGKSAVYFIATALRRAQQDSKAGPAIVICPLLALAADQVSAAERYGLNARAYNSDLDDVQKAAVIRLVRQNKIDLLYLTPEMLTSPRLRGIIPQLAPNFRPTSSHSWHYFAFLVIDEAHCVSEWGHGFRPAYKSGLRDLTRLRWYTDAVKLATSATVNTRTQRDLEPLGVAGGWQVVRGPLLRDNLEIRILEAANKQAKERWLVDSLQMLWQDQNVLIFYNTHDAVNLCAKLLIDQGIHARAYHGRMAKRTRSDLEKRFKDGRLRVLVATEALGMGFDKPDIDVVVHMETPSSPIRYYQEIGRAGRAREKARAYLVPSRPFNTDRSCATAWRHAYKLLKLSPAGLRQQDLRDALVTTHAIRAKISDAAIANATSKGYLVQRDGVIQLSPIAREIEEGQDDFIASREEEMKWMEKFPAMRECLWRSLLVHMQRPPAENWACGKCSVCLPEVDDEIQADAAADMEVCYRAITPGGVPVYSLGMHQDQVLLDSEKIRAILAQFVKQLSIDPPSWMIAFVPSASQPNKQNCTSLSQALSMQLLDYVDIISAEKVTGLPTLEQRQQVANRKFGFRLPQLPCEGVLLYDNVMSSGATIDAVARGFLAQGIKVVGLVQKLYPFELKEEQLTLSPY